MSSNLVKKNIQSKQNRQKAKLSEYRQKLVLDIALVFGNDKRELFGETGEEGKLVSNFSPFFLVQKIFKKEPKMFSSVVFSKPLMEKDLKRILSWFGNKSASISYWLQSAKVVPCILCVLYGDSSL